MQISLNLPPCQVFSTLGILDHLIQVFCNLTSPLKHLRSIENIGVPEPPAYLITSESWDEGLQVSLMSSQVKNR